MTMLADRLRTAFYLTAFAICIGSVWAMGWADAEEVKGPPDRFTRPLVADRPPAPAAADDDVVASVN